MPTFQEIRERLKAAFAPGAGRPRPFAPGDLIRRRVRVGAAELPILNLAGLWALRALTTEGDDARNLLVTIWVLRHQDTDRIADVAAQPPTAAELAALGREIDLVSLPDYAAALEEMLSLVAKKKAAGPERPAPPATTRERPSSAW